MAIATATAIIGAAVLGSAVAIGATVVSAGARKKQAAAETQRADLKAAQSRRSQVREARIRRGRLTNQAVSGGGATSSSFITGASAIQSALGQNLSFLDADLGLQRTSIRQGAKAANAGAVASLGITAVNLAVPRIG